MTKDKYNLFGKKRAKVPRKATSPSDPPLMRKMKPKHLEEPVYAIKISKLEPPEDPRPEVPELVVRPQLTGHYLAPKHPLVGVPEILVPVLKDIPTPVKAPVTYVATSTASFFSAVKPLAVKPLLKIPEPVLKEVPLRTLPKPAPLPGSREAKLRDFISKHF